MGPGGARTYLCPQCCTRNQIVIVALPRREMVLCFCKACKGLWFDGPNGPVQFSDEEIRHLREVRRRYYAGDEPL